MAAVEAALPTDRPGATIVEFNNFIQHGGLGKNRSNSPASCCTVLLCMTTRFRCGLQTNERGRSLGLNGQKSACR